MESVKPSGSFQREHENSRNQSESLSEHRKHKRHFSVTDAKRSEKSATSRGTKLPEVADEALALVDAPEAELDGDLEADRRGIAVGQLPVEAAAALEIGRDCGIGSWGGRYPILADYARGPAATRGAIAAGGASVAFALILSLDSCRSRRNPVRFPYSHVIPKSIPTGFSERLTL